MLRDCELFTEFQQVITNILTNAAKYTEKGEINFNVNCINENDNCSLVISVEDTGRGIHPDKISTLFTKFNRLDEDKNTTIEGTGLGLAITKSLSSSNLLNLVNNFSICSSFIPLPVSLTVIIRLHLFLIF